MNHFTDKTCSHIKSLSAQRKRLVDWVHERLTGPGDGDAEMALPEDPVHLFVTAVLFPIIPDVSGIDPASLPEPDDDDDDNDNDTGQNDSDSASAIRPAADKKIRYIPPSSAGLSCYVSKNVEIDVFPWAVSYEFADKTKKMWKRIPAGQTDAPAVTLQPPEVGQPAFIPIPIWNGKAEITALWRRHENGWLLTLSLCNRQKNESINAEGYYRYLNELSFFEVRLRAEIKTGELYPYPQKDICRMDAEEQELDLLYRHHLIYAVGHGAAVDWKIHERVPQLELSFFPAVEVPLVSPDAPEIEDRTLTISFLAGCPENPVPVFSALDRFVDAYGEWLKAQDETAKILPDADRPIADRMLGRVAQAACRMRQGIEFLRQNPEAVAAFGMANAAMLRQMKIGDTLRGRPEKNYRWRPFQLGFFLLSLEPVANENSDFRDIVDLIWFPTGGGKTEAYLALIAFLIIWRRLTYKKSGGGTVVILRYTLRLLTQQQFQRSIRLICALELLRRDQCGLLGQEPITGGLWVGGVTTPNSLAEALEEVIKTKENQRVTSRLVFIDCPWCGNSLWYDDEGDITARGIESDEDRFEFRCSNTKCEFGNTRLPFQVVDEALYQAPPTLLLATVDKFARLAWEERATVFFGRGVVRPPELIVQDELHLITGALGSIAGLYEAALDTVLQLRGVHPKYIASTATIRNASKQVQRLFGRQTAIFPPTGLSIDDSFFARTIPVETMPGRLYLGYFAPYFSAGKSFAPLAAALLLAPIVLFMDQQQEADILDAWWTLVVYHGSLRGVGVSDNLIGHEARNHAAFLIEKEQQRYNETHEGRKQKIDGDETPKTIQDRFDEERREIVQLTSLVSPEVNSRTLSRLERRRTDSAQSDHLDVVLTTNMLSVGVDVERLALMVINGQPLTTAEYIQASSRVGRGATPGIVVAHYYRNQARSLSHYENFRPFHESFYRYVEPGSSTPFTAQARERALHAALVIVVRHGVDGFCANGAADRFDPKDAAIMHALSVLNRRCRRAHPERESDIQSSLNNLTLEWANRLNYCRQNRRKLVFSSGNRANASLLKGHDQTTDGLWPTLHSMRNVEDNVMLRITNPYTPPTPEES